MEPAMHIKTKVLPGNRIEINAPEFAEGEQVDVFVVVSGGRTGKKSSVLDILASRPQERLFRTAQDVDDYLKRERESWDR